VEALDQDVFEDTSSELIDCLCEGDDDMLEEAAYGAAE